MIPNISLIQLLLLFLSRASAWTFSNGTERSLPNQASEDGLKYYFVGIKNENLIDPRYALNKLKNEILGHYSDYEITAGFVPDLSKVKMFSTINALFVPLDDYLLRSLNGREEDVYVEADLPVSVEPLPSTQSMEKTAKYTPPSPECPQKANTTYFGTSWSAWSVKEYPAWSLGRVSRPYSTLGSAYILDPYYFSPPSNGNNVVVYLLDSGVDTTHVELSGVQLEQNFVVNEPNVDTVGHGSFIASIIMGGNNGVASASSLISVKVLDSNLSATVSIIVNALTYVQSHRATYFPNTPAVVNLSVNASTRSQILDKQIVQMGNDGFTCVISAGNNAGDACEYSPTGLPLAITVSSIDPINDQFSTGFANYGQCVDLFAPGGGVLGAKANSTNNIQEQSGSSLSAGFVSGISALILSANPSYSPQNVKCAILNLANKNQIPNLPDNTPNLIAFNGYLGPQPDIQWL